MAKIALRWSVCDKCNNDIPKKEDCKTLRRNTAHCQNEKYTFCNECYGKSIIKEIDDKREDKRKEFQRRQENISGDDIPDSLVEEIYRGHVDYQKAKNQIAESFALLTDRDKYIISRRFGFFGQPCATLVPIANEFCVTRERIRQIEIKALRKIKYHLKKDGDE